MASVAEKARYTPEEYLAFERKAERKHQYYNGEIFAMPGASREHNLISGNLSAELRSRLRDRPCEVYVSDMRVRVTATGLYTYPDVAVVCDEPRFLDREVDTLLNPTLIAEVLSPSTEAHDRGWKLEHYVRLGSLREYVMVAQDRVHVERYTRLAEGWAFSFLDRRDDVLTLASIGCEVPLREVYERVDVPEGVIPEGPPEARGERRQETGGGAE